VYILHFSGRMETVHQTIIHLKGSVKEPNMFPTMKLRKSLVKPVTQQNITSCSVLLPEIVMHNTFPECPPIYASCNQQVAGSKSLFPAIDCNLGQVVNTRASVTKQYNLVPANVAGKVTVGLASHWPRVTDISGSPPTGSRSWRGR